MNDIIIARVDKARALLLSARNAQEAKQVKDMAHAVKIYAFRQKLSRECIHYAHSVEVDAETLMGEFLLRAEKNKGASGGGTKDGPRGNYKEPRDKTPTLAAVGLTKKESSNAQFIATLKATKPEIHQRLRNNEITLSEIRNTKPHVSLNLGDNEWFTPKPIIEAARLALGSIDLDPASHPEANKTVKAKSFFTWKEDGLKQKWTGNVWLNPPYSQPLISEFCKKLIQSLWEKRDRIRNAIVLVNNATETDWFQSILSECHAICFPKGRIRFLDLDGNPGAPLQGQAILLFGGSRAAEFTKHFLQFGPIFVQRHCSL